MVSEVAKILTPVHPITPCSIVSLEQAEEVLRDLPN
jgi:hypothetical protein